MTSKPATCAAEYETRTRDENKQRELHPHDIGSLDLTAMRTMPRADAKAIWATASAADKRGLAIQCIRHGNHGPDEPTIAMYLDILESQLGLSPIETAVVGALEQLALSEAQSARTARAAGLKDDAKFFQRAANAYAKALSFYRTGMRPEPTAAGYLLPSQRPGEPPHLLYKDGDWICTCQAGESMHWAKALIVGLEVAYDDMAGGSEEPTEEDDGDDDDTSDIEIQYENVPYPHGIGCVPDDQPADDFSDVGPEERARLDDPSSVRSLVDRLTEARKQRIAA